MATSDAARRRSGGETHRGTCPLDCPDACGLLIETDPEGQLRRLRGDPEHPVTRGFLCGKTARYHELALGGGRLLTPLRRRGGSLDPCTWEEAVGIVAERVAGMRGEDILPLGYAGNMGMVARRFPRRMMHALGAGSHDHGICTAVGEAGHRLVLGDLVGPDLEEAATAELADVVLPACFFFEQTDLYRSYGHRYLHLARRAVEPPVGPKSNVRAFAAIARALGLPSITWEVTEESLVEDVLQASGDRIGEADLTRLKAGERVKLPPRRREGRGTPSGKVELYSEAEQRHGRPAMATWTPDPGDAQRPLWLCPVPSVATHNSTFFASERHKERAGPPSCWIHPDLARARGVQEGDLVRLQSDHGSLTLRARITSDVPADMVRVDGMPRPQDTPEAYGVNVLTGPETSDLGVGATFYSTRVELLPVV